MLLLDIPGQSPSAHIGIYLPTRGHDHEWVIALAALSLIVEDIQASHPDIPIYIRGDANFSPNHLTRPTLLWEFMDRYSLGHSTYHHFNGGGTRDSQLDMLISSPLHPDLLVEVVCKLQDPLILSSHDIIISTFLTQPLPITSHPKL